MEQTQPCGAKTLIFQVGKSGINVGRIDFTFRDRKTGRRHWTLARYER